jgi:CBS domain-containing protein
LKKSEVKVSEIMTSPVTVTQKEKNIAHVRGIVERKGINAIPVLTMTGEIEGIITSNDIARISDDNVLVADVMTTRSIVMSPDSGIKDAARMMEKNNIHHVIIMEDGQISGIVSTMDLMKYFANQ